MTIIELKKTLKEYFDKDQKIRRELFENKGSKEILEKLKKISDEGSNTIKKIIDEFGLITISKYGKDASLHAFVLIQHMPKEDLDFMKKYSVLMENNMDDISKDQYALLKDKIAIYQGEQQLYGTQTYFNEITGRREPLGNVDYNIINMRRKELGLTTLEEYLEI
jgi:hypothetical protein